MTEGTRGRTDGAPQAGRAEPAALTFDPFTDDAIDDPYPLYARLRAADPVHWSSKLRSWVLLRHADVSAALRDDERLSAERRRSARRPGPESAPALGLRTVASDPPACLPVRAMLNAVLAPRVRAIGPHIDALVGTCLDRIAASAAGEIDLIAALAYPLPTAVIAALLGVPAADRAQFEERTRAIARGMDRFYGSDEVAAGLRDLGAWFVGVVQARRGTPGDDLVRQLLEAEYRGDRLTELEVVAMCSALVFGGHETTIHLIGNGMLALLRHPDALGRLRAEPALIGPAVEELLRYDAPAQLVSRTARVDLEVGGKRVRAGDTVLLALGAANRDPDTFDDPDRLDVARARNPHLAFGLGTHACPGAQLARTEARAAIGALLQRFSRIRLGAAPAVRRRTAVLRGLERLPVRVD
jgi:cytochrome P450